jgi:NRPS condensation-like uncharacterized protein
MIRHAKEATRKFNHPTCRWALGAAQTPGSGHVYVLRKLGPARVQALNQYRRRHGATVHEVLMAGYFRAAYATLGHEGTGPLPMGVTVDLRRYLRRDRPDAVCNLSGVSRVWVDPSQGTFDDTLREVRAGMSEKRASHAGIEYLPFILSFPVLRTVADNLPLAFIKSRAQRMAGRFQQSGRVAVAMANLGAYDAASLSFGDCTPSDFYITGPVQRARALVLTVTRFDDTLTFTLGFDAAVVEPSLVHRLLDRLEQELAME